MLYMKGRFLGKVFFMNCVISDKTWVQVRNYFETTNGEDKKYIYLIMSGSFDLAIRNKNLSDSPKIIFH